MNELNVPIKFSGSRETKTFVFLYKTAKRALSEAETKDEARIYNLMTVYVFLAFAFEAFINHLGHKSFSNWAKEERSLGQIGRREKVFKEFGLAANYNELPYSVIPEIFLFRDSLAHGITEIVTAQNEIKDVNWKDISIEQELIPSWLSNCTLESSRQAINAIEQIINTLGEKAGEKLPLGSFGGGSFSFERLDKST